MLSFWWLNWLIASILDPDVFACYEEWETLLYSGLVRST